MSLPNRIRLHYSAEFALAAEEPSYPKTDNSQLQLRGPMDADAFAAAYDAVVHDFPITQSLIEEAREGLSHRLYWVLQPARGGRPANPLQRVDLRAEAAPGQDPVQLIQDFHAERTARVRDLTREFPILFFLLRLEDEVHVLSMVYHHIAVDAASGYELIKRILAEYHRRVTGEAPPWGESASIASQAQDRAPASPPGFVPYLRDQLSEYYLKSQRDISQVAGTRRPGTLGRTCHRAIFEPDGALGAMKRLAKKHQASLSDVLLASISRTIATWDRERGLPARSQRCVLVVNSRGRIPETANESIALTGLALPVTAPDVRTLGAVVEHFRDVRSAQWAAGVDVANFRLLDAIARSTRLMPRQARYFLARRATQVPVTFLLSNIGIMWPEVKGGRMTGRSELTEAGGLSIDDVHSCPSMAKEIGLGVIARTLGGRLFINYSADRWRFTDEEAKALTDRINADLEAIP
ncbi:MAG: hypothetical protein H6744_13705 [Deltaproteobacteria bacterium]|nr:hypothetical protein [Deltaproteobacteria bacterium]